MRKINYINEVSKGSQAEMQGTLEENPSAFERNTRSLLEKY